MGNPLYNVPGLGGYLGMQDIQQDQESQQLRQAIGLASLLDQRRRSEQEAQLAPLRMQLLQSQAQNAQLDTSERQGANTLLTQLGEQYRASQTPKEYPSEDGVPQTRTELPSLDAQIQYYSGMLQNPKTAQIGMQGLARIEQMQATAQDRQSARQQRMEELQMRLNDSRLAAQDRANLSRELARMQIEARRDMAVMASSMRQPPAPSPVTVADPNDPNKAVVIDARSGRKIGAAPPPKAVGAGHLTESEAKGTLFYRQMRTAGDEIDKIVGGGFSEETLPGQIGMRLARSDWTNWMAPAKAQQYAQSTEQWAEAYLRLKTGAATNRDEIVRNARTYFPQPGDSTQVIAQKNAMRRQAESDVSVVAGRGVNLQQEKPQAGASGGWSIQRVE